MNPSNTAFKDEIHKLAEDAFHRHLISGYGDGEYADKYQIVYQGKPRHLSLKNAYAFLANLLKRARSVRAGDR
ncbi:hypothetical protein K9N68_14965 [Kovacikia minuta CCNUW1]|uniref:hypothetical protein n=1 Tax=Kovacikia minuta TaxID=2931930 RepID=UPI001CCD17F3|nr:hypothetical protein [Kovacikia minuta]UBF29018.1 hypothetical protein K9N68_14965 [Kovacikia minuta CCNUW1]